MPCDHDPAETSKRKSITQHVSNSKRQKSLDSQFRSQSREADFWDGLSKIWLIKHALRELDRRKRSRTEYSLSQAKRPRTRSYYKKLQQRPESTRSIVKFPDDYLLCTGRQIKLFARHGRVDLTDLRGVRDACSLMLLLFSNSSHSFQGQRTMSRLS